MVSSVLSDLDFTSLDPAVGVPDLLFGGVDVGVTVVQVTQLVLSVELTPNRVWSRSSNGSSNRSSSWSSSVGHHCLSSVGEGVVWGIVVALVAMIATIAMIAMIAMVAMVWLIVRLVRLIAGVEDGRLDGLSTGGPQKAGHDLQGNGPV